MYQSKVCGFTTKKLNTTYEDRVVFGCYTTQALMHRVGRDDLWAGMTLALLCKILALLTHSHDHRL
jgi:hypothetical protein